MDLTTDLAYEVSTANSQTRPKTVNPQLLARLTGFLFIVTFVTSIIPVVSMYVPVLSDPAYVVGTSLETGLSWGAVLEIFLIIANMGTALALHPVLKHQSEALSLSYIAARTIECMFIGVGILALLAVGSLRLSAAGADNSAMIAVGQGLVALHNWTFRLGPGVVVGVGNGLILGWLMWQSRLVPRALSILGLVGGPLVFVAGLAVVLGYIEAGSVAQGIATIPEFFWELGLGFWLLIVGFNKKALAALMDAPSRV
jgi:hypothetical protein